MIFINILISINDNYVECAIDTFRSISFYNKDFFNIYLIYDNLSEESIDKLQNFIKENNIGKLYLYFYDFKDYSFNINIKHISRETYFRLYAPYILPKSIDKILYIDVDIICRGSIKELYNTPLDGNIFGAVENVDPDVNFLPWINQRLGLDINNPYYNAGVLLIDLNEYRNFTTAEEITKFINENEEIIWCQDQDVINKMFNGKIKKLDDTYNYQVNHIDISKVVYNKVLTHYLSSTKPWKKEYFLPFHGVNYYRYLLENKEFDKFNYLVLNHISNANLNIFQIHDLLLKIFE